MPGIYNDGNTIFADALTLSLPTKDGFAFAPPSEFTNVPVTNIAYSQDQFAGPSATTISALKMVCSTGNTIAKVHLDLNDLMNRTTVGKGMTINSVTAVFTLTTQPLTAAPAMAVVTQTFGAVGTAAAAPTAAATAGGTITVAPVSPTLTVPTAGQCYQVSFTLGTPLTMNNNLQRAYAELTFPLTNGTILFLVGAFVNYSEAKY